MLTPCVCACQSDDSDQPKLCQSTAKRAWQLIMSQNLNCLLETGMSSGSDYQMTGRGSFLLLHVQCNLPAVAAAAVAAAEGVAGDVAIGYAEMTIIVMAVEENQRQLWFRLLLLLCCSQLLEKGHFGVGWEVFCECTDTRNGCVTKE